MTLLRTYSIINIVKEGKALTNKGGNTMEVLDMAISEKELKLLMNFIKDDLTEAKESDKEEVKNQKIERVLEHIQQYLED